MAETASNGSITDADKDFDPSVEQEIHDYDDETTLEEEEAISNGSCQSELDDLNKEGDMPLDQLLAMYGYSNEGCGPPPSALETNESRSSSEEEILSNQDLTLDKDEIGRDLLNDYADHETSVHELMDCVDMPSQTERLLRSNSKNENSDIEDSTDDEYVPNEDWKKTISVGLEFQAVIQDGLSKYNENTFSETDDRLLWNPGVLGDEEVEDYLAKVHKQSLEKAQGVHAIPTGAHTKDDEQALYLLCQCKHNIEEALRRRKMQTISPSVDPISLWSEEECRNFENGLRLYGKDFYLVQQNKVRTRSVGELVQFYYLWKKTERHDVFANKTRLEKKKYILHPGVTDYMDRLLDEQEHNNLVSALPDRSSSPVLTLNDAKRHNSNSKDNKESRSDLQTAFEMVQKVVETDQLHKINSPTVCSNTEIKSNQTSVDNSINFGNFSPIHSNGHITTPSPVRNKTLTLLGHDANIKRRKTDCSVDGITSASSLISPSDNINFIEQPTLEASASSAPESSHFTANSPSKFNCLNSSNLNGSVSEAINNSTSHHTLNGAGLATANCIPAEAGTSESVIT